MKICKIIKSTTTETGTVATLDDASKRSQLIEFLELRTERNEDWMTKTTETTTSTTETATSLNMFKYKLTTAATAQHQTPQLGLHSVKTTQQSYSATNWNIRATNILKHTEF